MLFCHVSRYTLLGSGGSVGRTVAGSEVQARDRRLSKSPPGFAVLCLCSARETQDGFKDWVSETLDLLTRDVGVIALVGGTGETGSSLVELPSGRLNRDRWLGRGRPGLPVHTPT